MSEKERYIRQLSSNDAADREEAVDALLGMYDDLDERDLRLLIGRFSVNQLGPEMVPLIARAAGNDPELLTDQTIMRIHAMLEHRWTRGYESGDGSMIETLHIILADVLDVQGAEAVEPAIYFLVDHIDTPYWSEWGEEALLGWLAARVEPAALEAVIEADVDADASETDDGERTDS